MKRGIMMVCMALVACMTVMAEKYALTYQGFPYKKTGCDIPRYAVGEVVKLCNHRPPGTLWFNGWQYNGELYLPGSDFTMPAEDVELVPSFAGEGVPVETVHTGGKAQKVLRDGQLVIVRDGQTYNVLGEKMN